MPYLIDGHNLIPHLRGLSLEALDDEQQLIERLQEFCRRKARQVEVFFDNAPPGQARQRRFGAVAAHFVRQGQTADDAIRLRLGRLGRAARNWTVVSSDRQVQAAARAAGAEALAAPAFAALLEAAQEQAGSGPGRNGLPPEQVDEWLRLFHRRKSGQD
jgi:hypothetical protein